MAGTKYEPEHTCTNCDLRHEMCGHDFNTDNCEFFVIGKCFRCKMAGIPHNECSDICRAEDMSGYGCPNFIEE